MSRAFSTLSRFSTLRSAQISPRAFSTSSPAQLTFVLRNMPFADTEETIQAFFNENGVQGEVHWPSFPDRKNVGRPYYWSKAYLRVSDDAGSQVKALNNQVLGGRPLKISSFTGSNGQDEAYNAAMDAWAQGTMGDNLPIPKMVPNEDRQ
ncbi:hypothetical protein BDY24DRAFT_402317 [Mrakia frigida]|uniref:RNA recognition motif domain-containing protein n=1 Tax=Mrakia frigida TaxID=29902 RepID=UPI003FCC17B1